MSTDPHPIHRKFADALASGEPAVIPVGRDVLCDACGADLTDDPRSGGFLFGSKGYGPCCAGPAEIRIRGYGEEWNIRARCPEGVSFADWIRDLRGPDAAVTITPGLPGVPR